MTDSRATIGVIDDDISSREAIAGLIESLGFAVASFASAVEFLAANVVKQLACIVVDVQMPGMSGLDLQCALAKTADAAPIIFVTSHEDRELRARALDAGAVAFLGKPVAADELLAHIETLPRRSVNDVGAAEPPCPKV
jgi:FixJ family two-component response regulator